MTASGSSASIPAARSFRQVLSGMLVAIGALGQEMSFLEHLEELRRRILWSIAAIVVAFGICWVFSAELLEFATAPIRAFPAVTLSERGVQDVFHLHMKVTLVAALFLASPLVITQAWLFIAPGLYAHERRYAIPFVISVSLLFVTGGIYGYFVAFPTALRFLIDWAVASRIKPLLDVVEYIDLFFSVMIACGITFQIPAVSFVLSRMGLVNAGMLLRYLRHAVIGCLIVAAVVTPTTDMANMVLIAGPMVVLYCIGIGIAWVVGRPRSGSVPSM